MAVSNSESDLLDFVGRLYDCVLEPQKWPSALERLCALLEADDAALTLNSSARPEFSIRAQWNISPPFEAAMREHYPANPLLPYAWYKAVDEPFAVLSVLDEAELVRTDWWKNTMGAFGYRDAAVSTLAKSPTQFGSISIQRKENKPAYDETSLSLLGRLAPHIRRAAHIGELLQAQSLRSDMLAVTLEALTVGVCLMNADGRIVHVNSAAGRLLGEEGLKPGDVISRLPGEALIELRKAIAIAAQGVVVDVPKAGVVVDLKTVSGRGLVGWVLPLDGGLRREFAAPFAAQVALFIRDAEQAGPLPAELFVRRYGITPAECRVLIALAQGMAPSDIATTHGVSANTVKSQIARLMEKTGCGRQTDLVRMALSLMPPASA